jgi:hypothetical protein
MHKVIYAAVLKVVRFANMVKWHRRILLFMAGSVARGDGVGGTMILFCSVLGSAHSHKRELLLPRCLTASSMLLQSHTQH